MSSASTVSSASDIQMDYMKLLVTQLQNQNPLEPLDNNEMAAQLAQFSELEQLENMNASFSRVLDSVQQSYARVEEVIMEDDGDITLVVDGQNVRLADVTAIRE